MSDEYAIRQLVEKYADAVNRVDKKIGLLLGVKIQNGI